MNVNIKKIKNSIYIHTFLITFSYETRKGYYREQQRLINVTENESVKEKFKDWADKCRTMFKVKILSIVEIEDLNRAIEI